MFYSLKTLTSTLCAGVVLLSAPSAQAARTTGDDAVYTYTDGTEICDQLAGREKARCENVMTNSRRRLQIRQASVESSRGNGITARERRRVFENRPQRNIRRVGSANLSRLRQHNRDGGNARRQIQHRDEQARDACRGLESTEKYECVRANWRGLSRGNTR